MIDNMTNLCRGHHKALNNFQIVGSSLEASSKIYGLRVDSVHSDIVRMSSGLGRMTSMFTALSHHRLLLHIFIFKCI